MLTTLPVASAPTARAELRKKKVKEIDLQSDTLVPQLEAARAFFGGENEGLISLDQTSIDILFPKDKTAKAIYRATAADGAQLYETAIGKVGQRQQVAEIIRSVWGDDKDWAEYACSALRFGIWQRCCSVAALLEQSTKDGGLLVARHLDAIRFLGQELHRVGQCSPPLHGESVYRQAWNKLREHIERAPAIEQSELVMARYCAAEAACFGDDCSVIRDVPKNVAAAYRCNSGSDGAESLSQAFYQATAQRIRRMSQCDVDTANTELKALCAWHWRDLPSDWVKNWRKLSDPVVGRRRFLVEMIADAGDQTQLESVVRRHAGDLPRTIFALGHAAVRQVMQQDDFDHEKDECAADLASIGATIWHLIKTFAVTRDLNPEWLPFDFAKGASAPVDKSEFLLAFLQREDASAVIARWFEEEDHEHYGVDAVLASETKQRAFALMH